MLRRTFLLSSIGAFVVPHYLWGKTKSPKEWWADASQEQKDFAKKCYEFGKQYGRGHTLAAIAWMESSLERDTTHEENSVGAFGISEVFIALSSKELQSRFYRIRRLSVYKEIVETNRDNFDGRAILALCLFEDNISRLRGLGLGARESYFWAYPRYNAGDKWRRFERRGEVFRMRVRFLVTQFK